MSYVRAYHDIQRLRATLQMSNATIDDAAVLMWLQCLSTFYSCFLKNKKLFPGGGAHRNITSSVIMNMHNRRYVSCHQTLFV